jgi:hypothetical protein
VKLVNPNERTYDSRLPGYSSFLSGSYSEDPADTTIKDDQLIDLDYSPASRLVESSGRLYPKQFPNENNPRRFKNQTPNFTLSVGGFPFAATPQSGTLPSSIDVAFRTGYHFFSQNWLGLGSDVFLAHRLGAQSSPHRQINNGRAYRYGISNVREEFTSARWKADHFGYLRDSLETRQDVAIFGKQPPIKVKFVSGSSAVSDPSDTHCQNLSTFATSSMPYFDDGIARNRSDNPDETLLIVLS